MSESTDSPVDPERLAGAARDEALSPQGPAKSPGAMAGGRTVLEAIMFTDIEDSVKLEQLLGTRAYADVLKRHGDLFFQALSPVRSGHIEKHTGDGFMVRFGGASDAVIAALRFQWLLSREPWPMERPMRVRIGIHQGEILLPDAEEQMPASIGAPVNLAARVHSLAEGGQVLLTRSVFDDARQFVKTIPDLPAGEQLELGWVAHGAYLLKGIDEPVEIFEVGERGRALFRAPAGRAGAQRSVSAEEEATLGWRPANEMEVPKRPGWFLQKRLGAGGFGEVWLARNRQTSEQRVFKFCFDAVRLRSFKRELFLFRIIREALGPRRDIVTLYEVQLEAPPFFLESEYCPGGTLRAWLEAQQEGAVSIERRLKLVADIARALAAAHALGIIHKDVKPSNIFVETGATGAVTPRLADFGIGVLVDRSAMEALHLSVLDPFTVGEDVTQTGTRMYSAPEYLVGKPPSVQGDIYSLGVLLYQMVLADFDRPLGPGWGRDVPDPLLAEDIASCVDVDPARRFSSALQLAERLETIEERRAAQQAAEQAAQREKERRLAVERYRRRMGAAVVSTAVSLVLIGALTALVIVLHNARRAALHHIEELRVERELTEHSRYVADMQASTDELLQRRAETVRELIERHRPAPGARDRRGWEWFYADSVLNTGRLSRKVSAFPLRALATSPDEQRFALGGDAGEISIWVGDDLQKSVAWQATSTGVRCLGWSPGGQLAAGFGDGDVALFDPGTGREQQRWRAHTGAVNALSWQPRETALVTGGADGSVMWWRPDGLGFRRVQLSGAVQALDWREDGGEIAVVFGRPAQVIVGAAEELAEQAAIPLKMEESALSWRPGGQEIALAMGGLPMRSWNPRSNDDSYHLSEQFGVGAVSYAWRSSGTEMAVGWIDGKILLFDFGRVAQSRNAMYGHRGRVTAMHWMRRAPHWLLSAGEDGTLRAWDNLQRSPQLVSVPFAGTITDAQWHPHDDRLAVLLGTGEVQIVRATSREVEWSREPPARAGAGSPIAGGRVAWSPDGRQLAVSGGAGGLVLWDLEKDESVNAADVDGATDLHWLADNERLLVRTPTGWRSLSARDGRGPIIPGTEQAAFVGGLPDNQLAAVIPSERGVCYRVINLAGDIVRPDVVLAPELARARSCALSRDRSLLAIAAENGALVWIDTGNAQLFRPGLAHASAIKAIAWHPDNSRLVTAGLDATCRIFNVPLACQNWVVSQKAAADVIATGWSGDGRRLMLASAPGTVMIYDASRAIDREKTNPR